MLFKMKNIAPLRVLHSLYYALFHSHLSYGICVWGNATNEALQPLDIAQNKIVRILSNADYDASTASLYSNLGIMKVEDIFKHQIGSLMWDIENRKLNDRFSCLFEKVSTRHRYNTRSASNNKLCTDFKENTSHGTKTFRNYGSKL